MSDDWQPIDTARRNPQGLGRDILALDIKGKQRVVRWRTWKNWQPHQDKPGWYISGTLMQPDELTHWKPLGKRPKAAASATAGGDDAR